MKGGEEGEGEGGEGEEGKKVRVILAGASFPSKGKKSVKKVIERHVSSPVEWVSTPSLHRPLPHIPHSFLSFFSENEGERLRALGDFLIEGGWEGEKEGKENEEKEKGEDFTIEHLGQHSPSSSPNKRILIFVNEVATADRLSHFLSNHSPPLPPHLLLHKKIGGKNRSDSLQTLRNHWKREERGEKGEKMEEIEREEREEQEEEGEEGEGEGEEVVKGVRVVVTTDLLSRGIDLPGVTDVINFDFPLHATDFLHRCGRTGRAGGKKRGGEGGGIGGERGRGGIVLFYFVFLIFF